jgi:ligand-binding SRPBCC domain-containing protein
MQPFRRQYQVFIDRPPEVVFDFINDLTNVSRLCPPEEQREVLSGIDTVLGLGQRYTIRLKFAGIVQKSEFEVSEWKPHYLCTVRQVSGPFGTWIHRVRTEEFQLGTLLTDQVEYTLAGPIGAVAEKLWLGKSLDSHFTHRHNEAKRLMELVGRIKGR